MLTIGPVQLQLWLILFALAILIAIIGIIFAQVFKMGFKYGINYEKAKHRRCDKVKRHEPVSQYYRTDMQDTSTGSVRVRKPMY